MVKNLPAKVGGLGSIPGSVRMIPQSEKWQPTPVLLPGKSHGQRSLVGYGPWGRKESAMTSTHGETKIQRVKTNKQISVPL